MMPQTDVGEVLELHTTNNREVDLGRAVEAKKRAREETPIKEVKKVKRTEMDDIFGI